AELPGVAALRVSSHPPRPPVPHVDQLLEEAAQRRQIREQRLERLSVDRQQVDVAEAAHRRRSRAIAHQRDLAEALAGPERAQRRLTAVRDRLQHLVRAIDDHVEPVPTVALAEVHLPRLEVLAAAADRLVGLALLAV